MEEQKTFLEQRLDDIWAHYQVPDNVPDDQEQSTPADSISLNLARVRNSDDLNDFQKFVKALEVVLSFSPLFASYGTIAQKGHNVVECTELNSINLMKNIVIDDAQYRDKYLARSKQLKGDFELLNKHYRVLGLLVQGTDEDFEFLQNLNTVAKSQVPTTEHMQNFVGDALKLYLEAYSVVFAENKKRKQEQRAKQSQREGGDIPLSESGHGSHDNLNNSLNNNTREQDLVMLRNVVRTMANASNASQAKSDQHFGNIATLSKDLKDWHDVAGTDMPTRQKVAVGAAITLAILCGAAVLGMMISPFVLPHVLVIAFFNLCAHMKLTYMFSAFIGALSVFCACAAISALIGTFSLAYAHTTISEHRSDVAARKGFFKTANTLMEAPKPEKEAGSWSVRLPSFLLLCMGKGYQTL